MRGAPKTALSINTKTNCGILLLIATCILAGAASANPPTVTAPLRLGDQFQFMLLGSNVPYIVEASTNLQRWSPVATNTDRSQTRVVVLPASESTSFYRVAEATPLFGFAIAASSTIDLGGNNMRVDSFDSSDPTHSTDGQYDSAKAKADGNVVTSLRITNSISVGNADVYGKVSTGPHGTVYIGPQGSIGDLMWHFSSAKGFEAGYVTADMRTQFTNPAVPVGAFIPPISDGQVGGTNYSYVLETGNWVIDSFSASNQTMIATGDAILYVTGSVAMNGTSSITISSGASLQMYVADFASFAGNGIINANDASKFIVFGLPTCTNIDCTANSPFSGCVYAPNATLTLRGTNSVTASIVGSFVGSKVRISGHVALHYDESLRTSGPHEVLSLLP